MASISKVLYIGVTNNIYRRSLEHKQGLNEGFTQKYNCHKLVHYDSYDDIYEAIEREKQLKRWRREKKVKLIERDNLYWNDLSDSWYE
jgi:putative endonuclease